MNDLQIQSLLQVFENLDIEVRQSLIPHLIYKAGIINRENVNNIKEENEREFIRFLFNQILSSELTYQYIEKCRVFIEQIKNNTFAGKVFENSKTIYYYLYQNEERKYFLNFQGEEISKEDFFLILLNHDNNLWKVVKIIKDKETYLSTLLHDLKESKNI